jgi:hypothetical protein
VREQSSTASRRKHRQGCKENPRRGVFARTGCEDDVAAASLLDLTRCSFASVDADTSGLQSAAREGDMELELSIPPVLSVSSNSATYVYSKDDPDFIHLRDRVRSGSDMDMSDNDRGFGDFDLELERRKNFKDATGKGKFIGGENYPVESKKWKSRYDVTRKYQLEWAAKASWSEALLKDDRMIHQVQCKTCSTMKKKDLVMASKWDTIFKHGLHDCHKNRCSCMLRGGPTLS